MITKDYCIAMAKYAAWQNQSHYRCAGEMTDADRRADRGAFFKSIHATMNHILWADTFWMFRLAGTPAPAAGTSPVLVHDDFEALRTARFALDKTMEDWASAIDPQWLSGDYTWHSAILKRDVTKPKWQLITHMFNHAVHHRGQVHAMLTQADTKPDDTDFMLMQL